MPYRLGALDDHLDSHAAPELRSHCPLHVVSAKFQSRASKEAVKSRSVGAALDNLLSTCNGRRHEAFARTVENNTPPPPSPKKRRRKKRKKPC